MNKKEELYFNIVDGFLGRWLSDLRSKGTTEEEIRVLYNNLPTDKEKLSLVKEIIRGEQNA